MLQHGKDSTQAFELNLSCLLMGGALIDSPSVTPYLLPETGVHPALKASSNKAGNLTPILKALPVIVCFFLHFISFSVALQASGLWQPEIIFSWEALVSRRPSTPLDAALSCRIPPWPHHKWQTLTKPQICNKSVFCYFCHLHHHCVLPRGSCRWKTCSFSSISWLNSFLVSVHHSWIWMEPYPAQPG